MNNNICQFYVVFGNRSFVATSNNNVYINATDIHDIRELSEQILTKYKEKAKQGIKVGSAIIFLIPNERYITYTEEVIKKLKVNGKIELMQPKKVTTPKLESTPIKNQPIQPKPVEKQEQPKEPVIKESTAPQQESIKKITKKEEKAPVYKPTDNVYRGTTTSSTYNNFQKPKKSNKAPIIIFTISLIFFVVSLLLLLFA